MTDSAYRRRWTRGAASALTGLAIALSSAVALAGWNPFSPGSPIKVGPQSGQIAIADFNGDGHGDILANHPLHGRASLLFGDGRGEFPMTTRVAVPFGYDPAEIAVGDVNGDQRPDLVVASCQGSNIRLHLLLGNGSGAFQEVTSSGLPEGTTGDRGWKPSLTLVDVNGDKRLDLVSANGRQRAIEIYYGLGWERFAPGQSIELDEGFHDYSHVVGDVNGDGLLDLTAACAPLAEDGPGRLTVLVGDEQGKLAPAPELSVKIPSGAKVRSLCDINGDERADIVVTHGELSTVLVQGQDGRWAPSPGSPFSTENDAFGVEAVDVGLESGDVLVAATVDSLEVVFAGDNGQFQHACHTPMPAGPGAYNLAAGDLNGDGKVDIVANSFEGGALTLLLSN